jgi:quercetin dioxygenase-like cupin family protein
VPCAYAARLSKVRRATKEPSILTQIGPFADSRAEGGYSMNAVSSMLRDANVGKYHSTKLQEVSMEQKVIPIAVSLFAAVVCIVGARSAGAQQQLIKRTDLLRTYLTEIEGKEMQVWVADIPPGAATGPHIHPTPRFVYVLEGAVILELDGQPSQTFRAGQAFVEMAGNRHNFRNASTTEPAKALGFQYAGKDQPLQTNVP